MSDSDSEDVITNDDKLFLLEMFHENPTETFFSVVKELNRVQNLDSFVRMIKEGTDMEDPPKFHYLGGRPVAKTKYWSEVKNLDELDFWKTMHMSRELFNHVLQLCEDTVKEARSRGDNIFDSECNVKLVIALSVWYLVNNTKSLAEASEYFEIASEDLVEDTLIRGFHILSRLKSLTIVWPTYKDLKKYSKEFQQYYKVNNVVGVLGSHRYTSERGEAIFINGIIIDNEFKSFDVVNTESLDSALLGSKSVLSNLKNVPRGYSVITPDTYRKSTIKKYNIIKPDVRRTSEENKSFENMKNLVNQCLYHLTLTFPRLLEPHRFLPDLYTSAVMLQNLINARQDFVPESR